MIIGTKISSKMFFFDKNRSKFTQEVSSLSGVNILSQLYDDACDEGFVMVSDRTQAEVPFYLVNIETNNESEILSWNFKSAVNRYSPNKKLSVTIFND